MFLWPNGELVYIYHQSSLCLKKYLTYTLLLQEISIASCDGNEIEPVTEHKSQVRHFLDFIPVLISTFFINKINVSVAKWWTCVYLSSKFTLLKNTLLLIYHTVQFLKVVMNYWTRIFLEAGSESAFKSKFLSFSVSNEPWSAVDAHNGGMEVQNVNV